MKNVTGAVAACYAARTPILVWGPPGVGKTSAIADVLSRLGAHAETLPAGTISDPADVVGAAYIAPSGDMTAAPPPWARRIVDAMRHGQPAALVIDELTCARPAVQGALLELVRVGRAGAVDVGAAYRCAAANPPDQAAGGHELSAPLATRVCHYVAADAYDRCSATSWAVEDWDSSHVDTILVARAAEQCDVRAAAWRARIAAYLDARPEMWCSAPTDDGTPWPCRRTWSMAARVAAAAEVVAPSIAWRLIAGCVGEAASKDLAGWIADADMPPVDAVMADPTVVPSDAPRQYAVLMAVAAAAIAAADDATWDAAWRVMRHVSVDRHERITVIAPVRAMLQAARGRAYDAPTMRALAEVLR